uniref:Glycosyltransferase family 92 protein n=1 Tax=Parascaris univalens TaxID=6257 RepID=A0A915APK6_PARUN
MSPLMDLLIILHILWISLSIILCITKKRRTERTESLFDLRADKAETDGSQGPDEKNTPTLGSNEKKAESLTPTAIGTTKPTKCASEVTQPLPASSTPSQPSRVITPPSPMFKSPPPRHPLKAPVKESTPLKYPDAKAKIVEPPAAIKNQPSAAAKPGSINQLSSDSRAAPGDVDAKAVGEAKNQGECLLCWLQSNCFAADNADAKLWALKFQWIITQLKLGASEMLAGNSKRRTSEG